MSAKLTTEDLLAICLDVAAGCKYLNEQHFIHRFVTYALGDNVSDNN